MEKRSKNHDKHFGTHSVFIAVFMLDAKAFAKIKIARFDSSNFKGASLLCPLFALLLPFFGLSTCKTQLFHF